MMHTLRKAKGSEVPSSLQLVSVELHFEFSECFRNS